MSQICNAYNAYSLTLLQDPQHAVNRLSTTSLVAEVGTVSFIDK
jgi:hypothetical protein